MNEIDFLKIKIQNCIDSLEISRSAELRLITKWMKKFLMLK